MKYDEIRTLVKDSLSKLIQDGMAARLENGPYDKNTRGSYEEWKDQYTRYNVEDYYEGDTIATNASRKVGELLPELELDSTQREELTKEFIRQYPKALQELLAFNGNPDDVDFKTNTTAQSISLTKAIEKHINEQVRGRKWKGNTSLERTAHFGLLIEILGDNFDAALLGKKDAQTVKGIIYKLPKNRNKAAKKTPISEIAHLETNSSTIKLDTANKYMEAYIGLCNWLCNNGYINENPFIGMKIDINKNAAKLDKRKDFTPEQIAVILNGLEDHKIKEGRKKYQYWGPLIAAYTGARIGEITQLYVDDIQELDGTLYFNINDNAPDKNLKTRSSERYIPVHPKLIEKGLLKYIDHLKANKKERLFPELTHDQKHGYGRNLSRWFNETYLVRIGLKTPQHVFHSLRHTVTTQLYEAGVQENIVKKILGHGQSGTTNTYYNHSKNLTQMREALEKLPY